MTVFTDYLFFSTSKRRDMVRITDQVADVVQRSGVREGMVLVSAMHITAGVYVNDWEDGLIEDFGVWLEKLAPAGRGYRHHETGEDNAAMIAAAGLRRFHEGVRAGADLNADPALKLEARG